MPLYFAKKLETGGRSLVFENVRDVEQSLLDIFADAIVKADKQAFFELEKDDGAFFRAFRFNTKEDVRTDYNKDYLFFLSRNIETADELSVELIREGEDERVMAEAYHACLTFDLDFMGSRCFDFFLLLRSNIDAVADEIAARFPDMRLDFGLARQDAEYRKMENAKLAVLSYNQLKFHFFLLKSKLENIKDINFFIKYDR